MCKDAQMSTPVAVTSYVLWLSMKLMDAFSSSKMQALQFSSCKSHFRTVSVSFFSIFEVKIIVTILCEVKIIVTIATW